MELEPLLDALAGFGAGGVRVRDWLMHATDVRRLALGVKDALAGSPHVPLALKRGAGARFLVVWSDGRVSRGYLERSQVEDQPHRALEEARRAAYDDPDAARVSGPAELPQVELHDAESVLPPRLVQLDGPADAHRHLVLDMPFARQQCARAGVEEDPRQVQQLVACL